MLEKHIAIVKTLEIISTLVFLIQNLLISRFFNDLSEIFHLKTMPRLIEQAIETIAFIINLVIIMLLLFPQKHNIQTAISPTRPIISHFERKAYFFA